MITWATQRAAIIKALEFAAGLPAGKAIWSDQNMPRPAKPYLSINATGFKNIGQDFGTAPDADGAGMLIQHKEFLLDVQAFSDGATDTEGLLSDMALNLRRNDLQQILDAEDLVYVEVENGPNCISTRVDAQIEIRSFISLRFRVAWHTVDTSLGNIEQVTGTETIYGFGELVV